MELSILCGSEVVLLVWGPAGTGKVTAYGSTDIHQLLSRYSQPDDPPSSSFTNSDYEGLFERKGKKGGPPAKKAKTSPTTPATPPTSRKSTPRATTRGRPYSPEQPKAAFVTTTTTTESPDCTVPPVSTPIESHPPTHNHPPPLQVLYPSPQEPTITTNTASSTNKASPDLFDTSLQIPFATYQTTLPFPSPGNYALPSSRITPVLEDTNRSEKMQTSRALTVKVSPARASSPTLPEAIITGSKSTTTTTTQSKVKPRWGNKRLTVHIPNLNSGSPSIGSPATLFSGPILSPFRPLPIITGSNEHSQVVISSDTKPQENDSSESNGSSPPAPPTSSFFVSFPISSPSFPPLTPTLLTPTPAAFAAWGQGMPATGSPSSLLSIMPPFHNFNNNDLLSTPTLSQFMPFGVTPGVLTPATPFGSKKRKQPASTIKAVKKES
eukprot:TRINITY_DN3626_c1_g1_i4.p1 TRINITY_DN3626_c1_g1~~TRINITY_DN3626_c1_g1_i4.p1  ORF type:complete len:489 (-),score=75.29 TRINITY_DN3626_c1_g1_i4:22-1335(-)